MAAASAAMCKPWRSRAARSIAPALCASAASRASSVIEAPSLEKLRLRRVRKAVAQLAADVTHATDVAGLVLDAHCQPQRLRVRQLLHAVDTPNVEARAFVLAAAVQHVGQIHRRDRIAWLDLVGAHQAALG